MWKLAVSSAMLFGRLQNCIHCRGGLKAKIRVLSATFLCTVWRTIVDRIRVSCIAWKTVLGKHEKQKLGHKGWLPRHLIHKLPVTSFSCMICSSRRKIACCKQCFSNSRVCNRCCKCCTSAFLLSLHTSAICRLIDACQAFATLQLQKPDKLKLALLTHA